MTLREHFILVACALLAACGNKGLDAPGAVQDAAVKGPAGTTPGGGTPGGGSAGGGTTGGSSADAGLPGSQDAGVDAAPPGSKPGAIGGGSKPPGGTLLCSRAYTGLDLARLDLDGGPAAFATAWVTERNASRAPGLVLRLEKVDTGPVSGALGPVYATSPTTWNFEAPPLTARGLFVQLDAQTKGKLAVIPGPGALAVVSFGDGQSRRGFTIKNITLDGILTNTLCETMVQTHLSFILPGSNSAQAFGGSTVGALLGPMTRDTDNDGTPDAWPVALTGAARFVSLEAP